MAKVSVTKEKLDTLAGKIATKSGGSTPMTIDEMGTAVDGISPGGGTYQSKSKTYTPSETAQSDEIEPDAGYDALEKVSVSVGAVSSTYVGSGITRRTSSDLTASGSTVTAPAGYYESAASKAVSGGIGTLLATKSLGSISTSSTSAADTGQTVSVTGFNGYDMLVAVTSCTKTNGRHYATVNVIMLAGTSAIGTIDAVSLANATLNIKVSSAGAASSRAGTTKYGVYVNAASLSGSTITLTMYRRYNSTSSGTINGTYTTKVYGVKIYENI